MNPLTSQTVTETATGGLRQVQQYNFSINILAMLLIGFGFLMVFIKNYGYSATTGITYLLSTVFRKGKPSIGDIANASLAGGVAIGATCNLVTTPVAFLIGLLAGALCVLGYNVIQPKLLSRFKILDTCGVHNLHGMPGLMGGLIPILVVPGVAVAQLVGIAFTVVLAFAGGTIGGQLIKLTGTKENIYEDEEEFAA